MTGPDRELTLPLAVRPSLGTRVAGGLFLVGGGPVAVLLGLVAAIEPTGRPEVSLVAGLALGFSLLGSSMLTAVARVSDTGIRYRYGFIHRRVPRATVVAVEVSPWHGQGPARVTLVVRCRDARDLELTAFRRLATHDGRRAMEDTAADIRRALGLDPLGSEPT